MNASHPSPIRLGNILPLATSDYLPGNAVCLDNDNDEMQSRVRRTHP